MDQRSSLLALDLETLTQRWKTTGRGLDVAGAFGVAAISEQVAPWSQGTHTAEFILSMPFMCRMSSS
jgi:hypothetical protein